MMRYKFKNLYSPALAKYILCFTLLVVIIRGLFFQSVYAAEKIDIQKQISILAESKRDVLHSLEQMSSDKIKANFGCRSKEIRRRIMIDGDYSGLSKLVWLQDVLDANENKSIHEKLEALYQAHKNLISIPDHEKMLIKYAGDDSFHRFGSHLTYNQAIQKITGGSRTIQAFKTIFETGENMNGYVHKLENHAHCLEYVVAVSDIIYGLMLVDDLDYREQKIVADPQKVQFFYVKAGEVIALSPLVLHSGSLAVESDGIFSVIIYKKPIEDTKQVLSNIPKIWYEKKQLIAVPDADKFLLTIEELHSTDELKKNKGYISNKMTRIKY